MSETKSLQLWPSGRSIVVRYEGDKPVAISEGYGSQGPWNEPTEADRRAIRIEELAELYQQRDIYHCDSSLVDDCLKLAFEHQGEFFREWDLENVVNRTADPADWDIEQCKEWLEDKGIDLPDPNPWGMDVDALSEALGLTEEDAPPESQPTQTEEQLRAELVERIDAEDTDGLDAWREAVREAAPEHEEEIYEWWRVSKWLARQLQEIGEPVLDNNYGYWWGRTCTGQQMIMDGTLQKVAARMVDEHGI